MQHINREHTNRRIQIKQPTSHGSIEHLPRLAQVGKHHSGIAVADQQLMALRHDLGVHVYVHHTTIRTETLRHLMHVAHSRQARSEINELPYSRPHQIPHHATQQRPVDTHHVRQMWCPHQEALSDFAISLGVMRSTQPAVTDSRSAPRVHTVLKQCPDWPSHYSSTILRVIDTLA